MAWSMGYGGLASLTVALALGRPYAVELSASYLLSLLYCRCSFGHRLRRLANARRPDRRGAPPPTSASWAPVVALLVSTLLEGFIWHPLTAAGVTVSLVGKRG